MSAAPATDNSKQQPEKISSALRRYLGKFVSWISLKARAWIACLFFQADAGEREATREVITLQLWILGQVAVLIGSIPKQPKPSPFLVFLFGIVAILPLASFLSIIGATKPMRNSIAINHYFDRNSVTLARFTLVFGALIFAVVGIGYMYAQFPGQAKPTPLKAAGAVPFVFPRDVVPFKIEAGTKGVAIRYAITREMIVDPLEVDVKLEGRFSGLKVVGAMGFKRTMDGKREPTLFQPEVMEPTKDGKVVIYWNRLSRENEYDLDVILYSPDGKPTPEEIMREVVDDGKAIGAKAFLPTR
ncbi:MAG: hypothetical protein ACR2FY_11575 [Pirellulaceae bacterium]